MMNYLETYKDISISSEAMGATPYQQIKLLLNKLHEDLKIAKVAIEENNTPIKCKKLSSAGDIISYLRDCLNKDAGAELTTRLEGIYLNLEQLLFWANAQNDLAKLNQMDIIVNNLITWWDRVEA